MSYLKANWWRLAAGVLVVLALAAVGQMGAATTQAVTPGAVSIAPVQALVGVGGTTTVNVSVTAPDTGLSVWIIEVAYNPAKVQVETSGGNPVCTSPSIAGTNFAGYGCATKDNSQPPDGSLDTAVAFGAWVKNDGANNAVGWTGTNTVATFTFRALAGAVVDDVIPLTITVCQKCFLGPNAQESVPVPTHGSIKVTAGTLRTWGDVDCSGGANPVDIGDSINVQRAIAHLAVTIPGGCPIMGSMVTVAGNQRSWGDVDCTGGATPQDIGDAINVERAISHLNVNAPVGCPVIGTQYVTS